MSTPPHPPRLQDKKNREMKERLLGKATERVSAAEGKTALEEELEYQTKELDAKVRRPSAPCNDDDSS